MNPHLMKLIGLAVTCWLAGAMEVVFAQDNAGARTISGSVQNQDLRRVGGARGEGRDQGGIIVGHKGTNEAGDCTGAGPAEGTCWVSGAVETYRRRDAVLRTGNGPP